MNHAKGGVRYQNGSKRHKRVVQSPSLGNVTSLERQLQAAAAHAESHGVHVDVIYERRSVLCLCAIDDAAY